MIVGQLVVSEILTSLFLLLPLLVFIFAIFYLLLSHLLNKIKNHKTIRPFLKDEYSNEMERKYILPMSYRFLGILLIVAPLFLYFTDNLLLMLFIILLIGTYYIKTPYKIEVNSDAFVIHLLTGKQDINLDDVHSVKLGVFHNRVDCEHKHFYLSHFLTNVSTLTAILSKNTGTQNIDQTKWDAIEKQTDSPSFWAYRTIVIIIFSILSSVLGVMYFISIAKQIH